jgi:uncharacterized FlgJ-related protein
MACAATVQAFSIWDLISSRTPNFDEIKDSNQRKNAFLAYKIFNVLNIYMI